MDWGPDTVASPPRNTASLLLCVDWPRERPDLLLEPTPTHSLCGSRCVLLPHFRVPPGSYHPIALVKPNPAPGKNLSVPLMPASALRIWCFAEAILRPPPPALTATLARLSFSSLLQFFVALENAPDHLALLVLPQKRCFFHRTFSYQFDIRCSSR